MLTDNSLTNFSNQIASAESPVPAGGSTVGATALLGASLIKLAYQVSSIPVPTKLDIIIKELTQAINEDVKVYQLNQAHNFQNQAELREIIEVPLLIAQLANDALRLAQELKPQLKDSVSADYQVGVLNLKTSITGAIKIIEANYSHFASKTDFIKETKQQVEKLK